MPWDMSKYKAPDDGDDLASRPDAASKFQRYARRSPYTVAPTHAIASRYYHVFREGELDALVSSIPGAKIEEAYFDHANWCVRIRKMAP